MLSGVSSRSVAIFISGGGSTLQTLLEMQHQIDISLVVTNKKISVGCLKAKRFGKKIVYLDKKVEFLDVHEVLLAHRIGWIILAGFMKLLPANFVELWKGKIINIHPSLLPHYPGLHAIERSWCDHSKMGVTLHQVIPQMDAGPILLQQTALNQSEEFSRDEAELFVRRTEQSLLRELTIRYF